MEFAGILREVFCTSLDGIVVTDADTVITDVNPAYEAITGFSRAELIGRKTNIIRSGLTPDEVYQDMWAGLNADGRWVGELINRHKDGHLWHSFVSITRVLNDDGTVAAYVGIARDVTQRKEVEQRLRFQLVEIEAARESADATANRLKAIVESVGEAIIMVNNKGICVAANHKVGGVLGVPADRIPGRSVHELHSLCARVFRGGGALQWQAAPGGGPPIEIQTRVVETREEQPRVFHEFSAPVQADGGKVIGRIYVYRDMTKETEVDRMKSEFIATVSHELRTPMTSIKGSLGLVLGGMTGPLQGDVRELLTIAQNNTDRLIRLINDILDISRIEAGKMEIRPAAISLPEAVYRAVKEMQGFADERQIQVTALVPEEMPRTMADADRLDQVLINLLSNAIKFTDPGGVVTVTAGQDSREVWIRVQDTGPGIAPEHHRTIFEKFQRVDNASTRKTGGTGLGLAICRAIVEEHGGHIWVESEPGHGSAFTFTLPAEPEQQAPSLGEIRDKTVLVVDDDPDIIRLIMLSLEQEGYLAVGATSGEQALEIARSRPVDAITLDLMMPGMPGNEVARQLKADPATAQIPVVVISAYTAQQEPDLLAMGVAGVIAKPIDEQKLVAAVRRMLGGSRVDSRGAPTILVVDDDPDVRRVVRVMLEGQGFATWAAADGKEAYKLIMEQRPDLLILDLLMPNLDGFQLVRLLRQRRSTQRIPLLVLTALDLTEGERTLLQLGPTRHLTKGPRIQEEVVARVRELLRT